jgi:hypothetical protein
MASLSDSTLDVASTPPRRAALWAFGTYALCMLALAWPALGGRFLVNPHSDQYKAGFAFRDFAAQSLRAGDGIPLWNPYLFGGMPYVAAMHGDIFYPTALLRMVLPTDVAMTWGFALHLLLAGWFTWAFLRAAGLGVAGALVGGIAYMLSGTVASYASPGHDGKLFVSALLPLALYAVHRGIADGRRWAWGLLALVTGLGVLSPHPQLLQYSLLTTGAYALYLAFRGSVPATIGAGNESAGAVTPPAGRRVGRLLAALGAIGLGMGMGAIQYWPVREYVEWSPRAGGRDYDYATSFSLPIEELINTWVPQFSGLLDAYWGRNGIHLHSEYLGVTALLLGAFALRGRSLASLAGFRWFWVGALVLSTLWALGGNTPFYQVVYAIVPGTKFFRAPSTMLYVVGFSTAVLAALGTERIARGDLSRRTLGAAALAALLIGLMGVSGGFTNLAQGLLGAERGDLIDANASAVVGGSIRSTLVAFALCAVAGVAVARRWSPLAVAAGVGALTAVDLWSIARHYWMFDRPARELFASDAVIEYLKRLPEPARVFTLRLDANAAPNDPYLGDYDGLMVHGIRVSLLGYHGNELGRFRRLAQRDEGYAAIANPNFWALTNTRFLYTNTPQVPFEGATLVAGPARNSAGTMVYLYRLPGEAQDAWVTPLAIKAPDDQVLATIQDPRFNVRAAALFAPDAAIAAAPTPEVPPAPLALPVTVRRPAPDRITVSLASPAPAGAALVVSENYYPGWRAIVDGKSATVERADYVLMGVSLPAGAREVELRFESPYYETGKRVSQGALLAAVLLIGWGAMAGRPGKASSATGRATEGTAEGAA